MEIAAGSRIPEEKAMLLRLNLYVFVFLPSLRMEFADFSSNLHLQI